MMKKEEMAKVRVSKEFRKDLSALLEYLWHDEKLHYMGWPGKKHIYLVMRRLAKGMDILQKFKRLDFL